MGVAQSKQTGRRCALNIAMQRNVFSLKECGVSAIYSFGTRGHFEEAPTRFEQSGPVIRRRGNVGNDWEGT
jgi:hypothetical protein